MKGRNSKRRVGLRCLLSIGKEASNEGSLSNEAFSFTAAGDWSLTDATIGGCSASTESTGSTVASRAALWEKRL